MRDDPANQIIENMTPPPAQGCCWPVSRDRRRERKGDGLFCRRDALPGKQYCMYHISGKVKFPQPPRHGTQW